MYEHQQATYDDLSDESLARLNKFRFLTKEELQRIKPVWIDETNANLALFVDFEEYVIVPLNTSKLIAHTHFLQLPTDELFTNDIKDFRYITTLERWQNGLPVDPPSISSFNKRKKLLTVNDGRHRLVLSFYLAYEYTPIQVSTDEKKYFIRLLNG